MTARAKELFETSVDQVRRGQVRAALATLLDALAIEPLASEPLEAAANLCRVLGSAADAERFEALASPEVTPEQIFDMGWHLVEQGRADVAAAYLRAALERTDDPGGAAAIRRELAYALLQQRDFGGCLTTLSPLLAQTDLAETELLDVDLMAAEAALYAGRADLSRASLESAEQRVPDDIQRERLDALHALLGRASRWERQLKTMGLREWHHVQHAGVLLKTAGGWFEDGSLGGRFELLELRTDMVAFLLQRLAHLLQSLDLVPEFIVPASELAAPLAHALGQTLDVPVGDDLAARGDRRALLIAASAGELAPFAGGLANHRSDLQVASLALDWGLDAPVCPDIAGVLARRAFLPWEARWTADPEGGKGHSDGGDERAADAIGGDLVAAMTALPDDEGKAREEFESFYRPLFDELLLGHPESHPMRRRFTHLSPAWVPTGKGPRSRGGSSASGDSGVD